MAKWKCNRTYWYPQILATSKKKESAVLRFPAELHNTRCLHWLEHDAVVLSCPDRHWEFPKRPTWTTLIFVNFALIQKCSSCIRKPIPEKSLRYNCLRRPVLHIYIYIYIHICTVYIFDYFYILYFLFLLHSATRHHNHHNRNQRTPKFQRIQSYAAMQLPCTWGLQETQAY